jgi:hypothetical protein
MLQAAKDRIDAGKAPYNCQDVRKDGRHPSVLYGAPKIAAQFLNFFKTNDTTMPWFLSPAALK